MFRIFHYIGLFFLVFALLFASSVFGKVEVYDNIEDYDKVMSFGGDSKWNKWDMDESVWPEKITDEMKVEDFKMVYYNPWDAQYLGYLSVNYSTADYEKEVTRLKNYKSTDYIGYYGVTEEKTYELLAIYADSYNGFVYALTDGESKIIYAEQIFCNYFMDLDCEDYMPKEYLLDGFDASANNPYRLEMLGEGK